MKDNKLFSAMSHIDEELINEAVNASKTKKLPVFRITAAAAALVFIALAATVLVNINKQPDSMTDSKASHVQTSEKSDSTKPASEEQKDKETATAQTSENEPPAESTPAVQPSETEQPIVSIPEAQTSEQPPVEPPKNEDEGSDMLGFIITDDGKTYMQVFYSTEYTLDKEENNKLRRRMEAFRKETGAKEALWPALVTTYGLANGIHSSTFTAIITMDDLFK